MVKKSAAPANLKRLRAAMEQTIQALANRQTRHRMADTRRKDHELQARQPVGLEL